MNSADEIRKILTRRNLKLSLGESCTGGLLSSILTDISGASAFIEINFVTYSEYAKIRFLNVPPSVIEKFGVVSAKTAECMALGLLRYSGVSISTTGYSGPSGGDENNPIGTVFYGFGYKNTVKVSRYISQKKTRIEIKKDIAEKVLDDFLLFLKEIFN
ncbi:MAG: CinA family protein [Candidatus Gastranaerophilales bacterium]|nr:CinA family protein [Candidatus Gastranaerophilales bacterium]